MSKRLKYEWGADPAYLAPKGADGLEQFARREAQKRGDRAFAALMHGPARRPEAKVRQMVRLWRLDNPWSSAAVWRMLLAMALEEKSYGERRRPVQPMSPAMLDHLRTRRMLRLAAARRVGRVA